MSSETNQPEEGARRISRRGFLKSMGALGAVAAAASALPLRAQEAKPAEEPVDATASASVPPPPDGPALTAELPIPAPSAPPDRREYRCDVLVVGGGFAGLNAAASARKAGLSVVLVDKGRPGYSGLAPFASSHRWFDAECGDVEDALKDCVRRGGDYLSDLDWYQVWIQESKETYQRLMDWGVLAQYPKASVAGKYAEEGDFVGYREKFAKLDRRAAFVRVLDELKIPYVERTMVTSVLRRGERVAGALGFDVPSGASVSFHAKAVVLCTGGGSYKSAGFPTSGDSFDGEYMGYQLGLPIAGKEFDDFHMTVSRAAGNAFLNNSWTYLENIWLCGGDVGPANAAEYADSKARVMVLDRVLKAVGGLANTDGSEIEDLSKSEASRKGGTLSKNPADVRRGKDNDNMPKGDAYGAAVGMGAHLSSGIYLGSGDKDLVGETPVPGLYIAGDGTHSSFVTGAAYPCGVGFTSSFCSTQGWRTGRAAAAYAASAPAAAIPADQEEEAIKELRAPLAVKAGFDPNWVRDELQAIMSPYWITIAKNEAVMRGALAQVEYMRDHVAPKLMATCPHELRLCHEMRHKILSAEMKLRAGLERRESRGLHYRSDYPYRDDQNFLCHITVRKGADGTMVLDKVPVKAEWKGDTGMDYAKRYGWRFPGEAEAKGLPAPKKERT